MTGRFGAKQHEVRGTGSCYSKMYRSLRRRSNRGELGSPRECEHQEYSMVEWILQFRKHQEVLAAVMHAMWLVAAGIIGHWRRDVVCVPPR
jgi:hypothetical protein